MFGGRVLLLSSLVVCTLGAPQAGPNTVGVNVDQNTGTCPSPPPGRAAVEVGWGEGGKQPGDSQHQTKSCMPPRLASFPQPCTVPSPTLFA